MIHKNELEIGKLYIFKCGAEYNNLAIFYINEKLQETNNFGPDYENGQVILITDIVRRQFGLYYKFLSLYNNRILYTSQSYIEKNSKFMNYLKIS